MYDADIPRPQIYSRIRLNLRDACTRPRGAKMKKATSTLDLQLLSTHNVGTQSTKELLSLKNATARAIKMSECIPK